MRTCFSIIMTFLLASSCSNREMIVKISVTTDVHGMIFPYDLINERDSDHSLAQVDTYIKQQRSGKDTTFFILDNGDILQGQPAVYYYNYVDTSDHLLPRVMNFMGYAAGTVGNHDIETGPSVYNRMKDEFAFPWLAANAVDRYTGDPYFKPYTLLKAGRYRIAVLGLITPGVPEWLPENLWPDISFRDMVETAKKWIPLIREKEKPDLIIGLFHSGTDSTYGQQTGEYMNENASLLVARQVPGFDLIFAGHDHKVSDRWITNISGDSVLVLDPGSHARYVGEAILSLKPGSSHVQSGRIVSVSQYAPDPVFMEQFHRDLNRVRNYLADTVVILADDIYSSDALFGPSTMMSLIHKMQLNISGADISLSAPLSVRSVLTEGPLRISDMFKLYRFENLLYRMKLSGKEIDGFLEYATSLWFNEMTSPSDHLLNWEESKDGSLRLKHPYYNYSSAQGIEYTVDLRGSDGERVQITRMEEGRSFEPDSMYDVAVNSYRGSGGGGHLIIGSGIPEDSLEQRIEWSSDQDLRYLMTRYLSPKDTLVPLLDSNWKLIPGNWYKLAAARDRKAFNP